jgi:hypothetical protein
MAKASGGKLTNVDGNHQFAWTGRAGATMRW